MEPCKYEDLIDKWKKEIPSMNKWIWKASGGIAVLVFLSCFIGKVYIGSVASAQDDAEAKTEKNEGRITALEIAMEGMKGNTVRIEQKVDAAIERADEDRQRSKEQQKAILEAIKDLNKDD